LTVKKFKVSGFWREALTPLRKIKKVLISNLRGNSSLHTTKLIACKSVMQEAFTCPWATD